MRGILCDDKVDHPTDRIKVEVAEMKIRNKYLTLKATTIVLGAVSIPWSMFTGYSFGQGNYSTGIASLVG
ncbi:MAG: hypothetical protein PHI12_06165 [Dehalococcoidales bacterium]|nr:hypothetical protein [Dehalococcoidales bacterium]